MDLTITLLPPPLPRKLEKSGRVPIFLKDVLDKETEEEIRFLNKRSNGQIQ